MLAGFTLGACIALQYGLDYPEEVKGLVLMTVAMRHKERARGSLEFRLDAAKDPEVYRQWKDAMSHTMMFMEPDLRERLLRRHEGDPLDCHYAPVPGPTALSARWSLTAILQYNTTLD